MELRDDLKVVVVIPTYNEKKNLPKLLEQLLAVEAPKLHAVVVDDGSPDGTGELADELASASDGRLTVLHRTSKDGLGRAYVTGMSRALDEGADVVIQMDADLSHPVEAIPRMLEVLLGESDVSVVLGSRYVEGGAVSEQWSRRRQLLSAWANLYVNAVLHLGVKDATAGFKAWKAETLRKIDLPTIESNGYSFQIEMNHRVIGMGMRIAEVPIVFEERTDGSSKMTLAVQLESAVVPWRLRRSASGRSGQ